MNRLNYFALACSIVLIAATGQVRAAIVQDFSFTGSPQSFLVPNGVSIITIEAWGAQGWSGSNQGGRGGYAKGDLSVTAGETLSIYVGGQGTGANVALTQMGGGFNGGGNGMAYFTSPSAAVGGGGGASDVRQSGIGLSNRVIVAGGGGGAANDDGFFGWAGGNGGGVVGGSVPGSGGGGTQIAGGSIGGSFGQGGNVIAGSPPYGGGGGGGGWFGGGVAAANAGGGGGSSYISGAGLSLALTIGGLKSGDGLVRFTYEVSSVPEPSSLFVSLVCAVLTWGWVSTRRLRNFPV